MSRGMGHSSGPSIGGTDMGSSIVGEGRTCGAGVAIAIGGAVGGTTVSAVSAPGSEVGAGDFVITAAEVGVPGIFVATPGAGIVAGTSVAETVPGSSAVASLAAGESDPHPCSDNTVTNINTVMINSTDLDRTYLNIANSSRKRPCTLH